MQNQTRNNSAKFVFSSLIDINSNKQGRYGFGETTWHYMVLQSVLKEHVKII